LHPLVLLDRPDAAAGKVHLESYQRYQLVDAQHIELVDIRVESTKDALVYQSMIAGVRIGPNPVEKQDRQAQELVAALADGWLVPPLVPHDMSTAGPKVHYAFLFHRKRRCVLAWIQYRPFPLEGRTAVLLGHIVASAHHPRRRLGAHLLHQFLLRHNHLHIVLQNREIIEDCGRPFNEQTNRALYTVAGFADPHERMKCRLFLPNDKEDMLEDCMERLPIADPLVAAASEAYPHIQQGLTRIYNLAASGSAKDLRKELLALNKRRWDSYWDWVKSLPPLPSEVELDADLAKAITSHLHGPAIQKRV
jgi:hypothetical protein